tara:strand:- start:6 stop:392 length:387 start_codon:yes stop_codon:yes gene_type:complete
MSTYINTHALNEIYQPIENEQDIYQRIQMINSLQPEFVSRHVDLIAKTCYDLKKSGEYLGQIADTFGISERRVKRLITFYSKKVKTQNPLYRFAVLEAMDISDLVQKGSVLGRKNDVGKRLEPLIITD